MGYWVDVSVAFRSKDASAVLRKFRWVSAEITLVPSTSRLVGTLMVTFCALAVLTAEDA